MKAAVIKESAVTNIIVAKEEVYAELETALGARLVCVDGTECGIGWTTEDGGASFTAPASEPEADYEQIIDILTGEVE